MDAKGCTLKVLFFPLMAAGHTLPMVDMAKLFADHGVKVFIITTPANAPTIERSIARHPIQLVSIPFPSTADTGLPEGCENASSIPSLDFMQKFIKALTMFQDPFAQVLREFLPDCVVTDMFFPWTYYVAAELGIPRLVFHGTSFFSLCVSDSLYRHKEALVKAEAESFIVPDLPQQIKMLKSQVKSISSRDPAREEILTKINESEAKSYGVVVNSFYELEPDYAQHYRKVVGRKAWHIGPVALCNEDTIDKSGRGNMASTDNGSEYLQWLDCKSPGSVAYVCFGSVSQVSPTQLREIALGLEESGHAFIWVVKSDTNEWIPEKFEERVEGRGLIIRGWAPQILILSHRAVGGFVTHCGWNSSLEGISAGLPMVTWPMFAEQFFNERMIVDLLKIGVEVGNKKYTDGFQEGELVEATRIARVVDQVMGVGEEADMRRRRARELGAIARSAVKKGGSSYVDMENLIQELMDRQSTLKDD